MNPDIQKIKAALVTAKHLNISDAAEELNFTPSAVSKQIAMLEKELKINLFERHSRNGLALTDKGKTIIPALQKAAYAFDELEVLVHNISDAPCFWLGTPPVFSSNISAEYISNLLDQKPDTLVEVFHNDNETLIDMLKSNRLDAVLSVSLGRDSTNNIFLKDKNPKLVNKIVGYDNEYVYLNENSALLKKDVLHMKDLLERKEHVYLFIDPRPNKTPFREKIFLEECKKRKIVPNTKEIHLGARVASGTALKFVKNHPEYVFFAPMLDCPDGVVRRSVKDSIFLSQIVLSYMKNNSSKALSAFLQVSDRIVLE